MRHSILCLDDEKDNVDALERLFRKKYRVFKATSGEEALDILAREQVSLIISDQRMPNMTGVEFLRQSVLTQPFAVRILLTGYTDIDSVIAAINSGEVYRYITKPWDPVDLTATVDQGIEKFELTSQLKQKNIALAAAIEELKSLDQAKNTFMMLINHELKTPLTSILSFSQLLHETNLTSEQKHALARITSGAARLKEIVDDVLQLIAAETGILPVCQRKVQASELWPHIEPSLEREIGHKNLVLSRHLSDEMVMTDPQILKNVIHRIVHNAVKFSKPHSEIAVRSSVHGDKLAISIENFGAELSAREIAHILKPFSLNENMMNHSKGIGLGLSLSQALLRRLGSELELTSHQQKVNVTFQLHLA